MPPVVPKHLETRRRYAAWSIVVLAAGWLLCPIVSPTHVEGFSASIVSLALHLNVGRLADFDRLHPANLEYFAHSRLGTVLFASMLTGPLRLNGDLALRLITWVGFVTLVISSFLLVRRWSQSPALHAVVLLLLIPAVGESAFFYNDTIFAAALGVGSLAMVTLSESTLATIGGGLLLGAAVVARLDAVLLAPAVVLVGYQQNGLQRQFWTRAAIFATSVAIPVLLIPAALGTSIFRVYEVTSNAVRLWGEPMRVGQHGRELALFAGMPVMILAVLGAYALAVRREVGRLLLLVGVPMFFNLAAFGKIWQARQLLPMTPFFASLALLGWQHVSAERARDGGRLRAIVVAICVLVLVVPPILIVPSDGPRAPYGRVWTPLLWMRWQSAVRANLDEVHELVAHRPRGTTVVVTDTWDGDRYLHLALQEAGYAVNGSAVGDSTCRRVSETFDDGDRRVVHVRLHQPFLFEWHALAAARLERWAAPCITSLGVSHVVILSTLGRAVRLFDDTARAPVALAMARAQDTRLSTGYSPQIAMTLSVTSLGALRSSYLQDARADGSVVALKAGPDAALARSDSLMRARVWRDRRKNP
jgi:hypothetical protein